MAILLTNGQFYIAHNKTGAVIKVSDISQAQNFYTVDKAIRQLTKTPGKCKSFYWIDTDSPEPVEPLEQIQQKPVKIKRKNFSSKQRAEIYKKSGGCCQLCGRKISFDEFTIDHIIPLNGGGTNDIDNLAAACKICNSFKADIYPAQFFDRITEIFMYQMDKKYSNNPTWKMARNMLMEIL